MQNNKKVLHQLRIAKGQMEGIIKMVEKKDYCSNVLAQLAACDKGLKRAASMIIENHLSSCIKMRKDKGVDKKIQEISSILRRYM